VAARQGLETGGGAGLVHATLQTLIAGCLARVSTQQLGSTLGSAHVACEPAALHPGGLVTAGQSAGDLSLAGRMGSSSGAVTALPLALVATRHRSLALAKAGSTVPVAAFCVYRVATLESYGHLLPT